MISKLRWLLPGLRVKRWILLGLAGILLFAGATAGLIGIRDPGPGYHVAHILAALPTEGALALLFFGLSLLVISFGALHRQLIKGLSFPLDQQGQTRTYLRSILLQRGPRIVVIGGGTGLSTILEGLKEHSTNLTAVVTVSDDGGSSGRLRKDLEMLPPGDIRNCLVALARRGPLLSALLQYRFHKGEGLSGHSFGNLLIAALTQMTGSFIEAIRAASDVLNIAGEVLPSTCQNVILGATFTNGTRVMGESKIPKTSGVIKSIFLEPKTVFPPQEVLERIGSADLVVLGPGSLYTSVVPNLLVSGIADAINQSSALVAYVANIMTQPGETNEYSLGDHVHALLELTPLNRIDVVVFNNKKIDSTRLMNYERRGAGIVSLDTNFNARFDITVEQADLLSLDGFVRHDPRKTAKVLVGLVSRQSELA